MSMVLAPIKRTALSFSLKHAICPNVIPAVVALGGVIAILIAGYAWNFEVTLTIYSFPILLLGPSSIVMVLLGACLWVLYKERPDKPTAFLWNKLRTDWQFSERMARGLPVFLLYPLFFGAFTSYKSALGKIFPFYFDPYAIEIDRLLHGMDPWILLHPILGYPVVTFFLNFCYNLWFILLFIQLALVMFLVSDLRLRAQYLTTFVLCWLLIGVVAATALSSAGPCFYDYFFNTQPYQPLFSYLDAVRLDYAVPARELQTTLLEKFELTTPGIGVGISAAPSMHVAIAVLNAILLSRYGKIAGTLGWGYATIILLGSIHLGWHYAIDGYISLIMTVAIWKAAGYIAGRFHGTEAAVQPQRSMLSTPGA